MRVFESMAQLADHVEKHSKALHYRSQDVASKADAALLERESVAWYAVAELLRGCQIHSPNPKPSGRTVTVLGADVVSEDTVDGDVHYNVRLKLKPGEGRLVLHCGDVDHAVQVQDAIRVGVHGAELS